MGSHDSLGEFGIDIVKEGIVIHLCLTYLFDCYIIEFKNGLGYSQIG